MNKPSDSELLHEIKECLVGTEFNRKGCVLDRLDKLDDRLRITQNQVNTLMQDREKRIEAERAKAASKLAIRKFLNLLTFGLIKKLATGI